MFNRILIANRGEIVCRIIKTCKRMGIETVAVYSDADADALHVQMADSAYHIGPGPASESYLVADRVLEIAAKSGADAVHPGYGFLSENAEFAEKCEDAGITFIGPSSEVIRAMGDKILARRTAREAGLPVLPGTDGEVTGAEARRQGDEIGYPLLVKAAGGGGGMGIQLARSSEELDGAIERAQSVSRSSFGNAMVYLERYVENASHVEVQVMGDRHGNVIHLFERECSVQRRNQKLIEETPCQKLSGEQREQLHAAAARLAEHTGYSNAGTVEFVSSPEGEFFFIEMNTRLQVEHPVTELVTGLDLVELQIRSAAGEALPVSQTDVEARGYAIEARVCAEDPVSGMPTPGTVESICNPLDRNVRVDHGLARGMQISHFYDPMIAKVIARGDTREEAIDRLAGGLSSFRVKGVPTNHALLYAALNSQAFRDGTYNTALLQEISQDVIEQVTHSGMEIRHSPDKDHGKRIEEDERKTVAVIAAAIFESRTGGNAERSEEPRKPISGGANGGVRGSWWRDGLLRLMGSHRAAERAARRKAKRQAEKELQRSPMPLRLQVSDRSFRARVKEVAGRLRVTVGGSRYDVEIQNGSGTAPEEEHGYGASPQAHVTEEDRKGAA